MIVVARVIPGLVVPLWLIPSEYFVRGALPILRGGNPVLRVELRAGDGAARFGLKFLVLGSDLLNVRRDFLRPDIGLRTRAVVVPFDVAHGRVILGGAPFRPAFFRGGLG